MVHTATGKTDPIAKILEAFSEKPGFKAQVLPPKDDVKYRMSVLCEKLLGIYHRVLLDEVSNKVQAYETKLKTWTIEQLESEARMVEKNSQVS